MMRALANTRRLLLTAALALGACGGGSKSSPAPEAPDETAEAPAGTEPAAPEDKGPPPSTDPVELLRIPPKVGEIRVVVEAVESDGTMLAAGREVRLAKKAETRRTEEVLAVDGDVVTQLKVTFDAVADHRTVGTNEQDVASPYAGKTFTIAFAKGKGKAKPKFTVTEGGKPFKGKAADLLVDEFRDDIGAVGYAGVALGGRTYTAGEAVTVPAQELLSILPEGRHDLKGEGITVTFVERRGEIATFELAGTLTRPEGKMTMTMTLKGTLEVDVPLGRPVKVTVEGDSKGAGTAQYTGTLKSTKTFSAP
jgi:hypothetical protein